MVDYATIKFSFINDIKVTGAKEGFTTMTKDGKGKPVFNYYNKGRFVIVEPVVVLLDGEQKRVPYSEYRNDPGQFTARRNTYGIMSMVNLKDFDHGHEGSLWMGANKQNPMLLNILAERLTDLCEKAGDDLANHVFEIGKEAAKAGTADRYYVKALGLAADLQLVADPVRFANEVRREKVLAEQKSAPKNEEIQNFVLTEAEKVLIGKIDQLAQVGKIPSTTRASLTITLEEGYGSNKSTTPRAKYIARNAEQYFEFLKMED